MQTFYTTEAVRAENESRHPVARVGMARAASSVAIALLALRRERASDRGRRAA